MVDTPPMYINGTNIFPSDFLMRYNHPVEEEFPPKTMVDIVISKDGEILSVNLSTKVETPEKVLAEIKKTIFSLSNWTAGKCEDINVTCIVSFPIMF